jgi:hypothetical protein
MEIIMEIIEGEECRREIITGI